jgi:hypothetical protein
MIIVRTARGELGAALTLPRPMAKLKRVLCDLLRANATGATHARQARQWFRFR